MSKFHLPVQSVSHQKETISRNKFNELFFPWICKHWYEDDYGIDAMVEITFPLSSGKNRLVTNVKFNVQLKSSEVAALQNGDRSISIPIQKINYWYGGNLPTMLCLYDLNEQEFFFCWIDENLINKLNKDRPEWIGKDSLKIRLTSRLNKKLDGIEKYVLHSWKKPEKSFLTAGSYSFYNNEIIYTLEKAMELANIQSDKFLSSRLKILKKELGEAIFSVAVAGESRVGKSSLVNAFLGRDVSPVSELPTTGVPICVFPSNKEECEIHFNNDKVERGAINAEFIEKYGSQRKNKRNKKDVKLILLKVVNQAFENGIRLFDIPGLNDPDSKIRMVSNSILHSANAIIYVISAAPAVHGEFILSDKMIDDIKKLNSSAERIFIVINKADCLKKKQFEKLNKYLKEEFKEYGLDDVLPSPPIYLSAEGNEQQEIKISNVESLKETIWDFLLSEKRTGLHRLFAAINQLDDSLEKALSIHRAKLLTDEEAKGFQEKLAKVKVDFEKQKKKFPEYAKNIPKELDEIVRTNVTAIINNLKNEYRNIPLDQSLFTREVINKYLIEESEKLAQYLQNTFCDKMIDLEDDFNEWVMMNLHPTALDLKSSRQFKNRNHKRYSMTIYTQINGGFQTNIIYAFFDLIGAIATGIGNGIQQFFIGKKETRSQEISLRCQQSKKVLNKIFQGIMREMKQQFKVTIREIYNKTNDRATVYLDGLEAALEESDTTMTDDEHTSLIEYIKEMEEFQPRISSLKLRLEEQVSGLKITE
jgi:ribosome biogenesis GTPase A